MMRRLAFLLFLPLCLLLAACDSSDPEDDPPETPSIDGTWAGTVTSNNVTWQVEMTITDDATFVTGMGTISSPDTTMLYDVSGGSYVHPLISLTLIFGQPPPGRLSGSVSADRETITGTMDGPGFAGPAALTMRQIQAARPAM